MIPNSQIEMQLRADLQVIASLVSPESRVLDLGCDDGDLLAHLVEHNTITKGRGIELSEAGVLACVQRGLSVRQGVGKQAIVSFPNWGHWRCRLEFLLTGQVPQVTDLPQNWYTSPRQQPFTITDFSHFCDTINVRISRQVYMSDGKRANIRRFKTLLASTAIFVLETK